MVFSTLLIGSFTFLATVTGFVNDAFASLPVGSDVDAGMVGCRLDRDVVVVDVDAVVADVVAVGEG